MAELPPILISGARTSAPGLDIPAATTTITREQIAETGARDLDEVLRQIPALHVSDGLGNGGNSRIDMRGFGATAPSNVAILINGRKINPATDGAALYLNSIDLDNVAQIEIIEGSAGTLYGNQAVGGLINIITRRPDSRSRQARIGAGSFRGREISASLAEPFSAGGGLQLDIQRAQSDNYRDRNASKVTRFNGRVEIAHAAGSSSVELQILDDYLETPGALFASELAENRRQAVYPNDFQDTDSRVLILGTAREITPHWRFEGELSIRDDDREFVQSFRCCAGSTSTQDRDAIEFTPRLIGRYNGTVFTAGIDILNTDYLLVSAFGPQGNDQAIQALYGQVTHPLSPDTSITAGMRHARVGNDIDNNGAAVDIDDDVTVGSLGIVHRPNPDWRLFMRADQNYRFAKVDEHTNVPFGQPVGLDTQRGVSYETGASFDQAGISASFNAYYLRLEDEISFDASSFFNINLPRTRRRGITTALDFDVSQTVTAGVSYAYVDSEITSGPFRGNEVPLVPSQRATAYVSYQPYADLQTRLDIQHIDEQFLGGDFDNSSAPLDAYSVVNLVANYNIDNWRLTAKINNLLDKRYSETGASGFAGDGFNPAPERNFWLGLAYSYKD